MKTKNIGIWACNTGRESSARPAARSATEKFSALDAANEVPPINTVGSGSFGMQIIGATSPSRYPSPTCHRRFPWPTFTSHRPRWRVAS